jgi:phosphatidylserine/phosphatidylglycerophosphate/cardiolipin synthase-like enzyme
MNEIITNGTEIKQRILSEINNATQSIYLAMAWFTDRDIATAIIEAKTRNVFVDVILSSNAQNETVKTMLRGSNISVHAFETGDARGIMHHKFCLIDSKISINGSYNYSYNASNNNVENIHVSDNLNIYQQLFSEFERLKYNIDHNIGVNEVNTIPENTPPITQPMNNIETFAQQLQNLVYSAAQVNCDNYKKKGYDTSKESQGNIDIFRTEYDRIKRKFEPMQLTRD